MYRILLADDESIVIESLKFIIEQKYGSECEIQYAKTGRGVIELAETFRPDIAFMDIQMPGINGIEAMKEIKKFNQSTIFIVMTAFDKFDYAKEAIDLGVMEYLSKPVTREKIENVLHRAMSIIDSNREKRSKELIIKEKLETVVPFIENGLIYTVFMDEEGNRNRYLELLGIEEEYAYVVILEAGEYEDNRMTNQVGSGVRLEDHYLTIKEDIRERFTAIVGPVMTNKIIIIVPSRESEIGYRQRIHIIDEFRDVLHKLEKDISIEFKLGIGPVTHFKDLHTSYIDAVNAMNMGVGSVSHAGDMEVGCRYEEDYPIETERRIFEIIERGECDNLSGELDRFWAYMIGNSVANIYDIKIKTLEFVLWAEGIAYRKSNLLYRFTGRTGYLSFVYNCNDMEMLKRWFADKMQECCASVASAREELMKSPVEKAVAYIDSRYEQDLSLESVSQVVDVSPYYLSKLFKAEKGVNFLDYLTNIRIDKAKEFLDAGNLNVKDVAAKVGYYDSNYFSRLFKKYTGVTPSEYRDKGNFARE